MTLGTRAAESRRGGTVTATFDPASRQLEIAASGLQPGAQYELRLEPAGLRDVELGRDVNEPGVIYLPPREGPISLSARPAVPATAENVFFYCDVIAGEWDFVICFGQRPRGAWKLNGRFSAHGGATQPEVVLPAADLEPGENLLHLEGESPAPPTMFFRRRVTGQTGFTLTARVTSADWRGRVALYELKAEGKHEIVAATSPPEITLPRQTVTVGERWWEDRDRLAASAVAVGRNVLAAQNVHPRSALRGGFHLVYDVERRSHRISHWIWSWGPAIKLLLELAPLPAAQQAGLDGAFRTAARAAGERSLAFDVVDPAHPAAGVSTVRWEPSRAVPNGWVEYISTADSLFLAGWGWMPLHAATGEARYLARTRRLVAAAERLMQQYPVVPQDWVVERGRWTPHTLDESVFGLVGFRELHAATRAPEIAAAGRRYLDSHLAVMRRDSGLLERAWLREQNRAIWDPDIKGHAWVVEGYLDAHSLSGDGRYLELARALARRVIACQDAEGAWTHRFQRPTEADARDDKGTAIWAFMLYELHRATRDPEHLAAARRALGWCLRRQYRGSDPNLEGGLLHANSMAYVRHRPMTILYSTTFFGLALLQELRLDRPDSP